jgi:hypothetical protein
MKIIILSILFLSYGAVFSQSKKEDRKEKREQKKEERERYRVLEAQRNNLLFEIKAQKQQIVLFATYKNDFKDIYSAMYQVVSSEYNTIQKESESRGYIDAYQESDLQKDWLTSEIKGKEGAYKVSFIGKGQKRTKNKETGVYSAWTNFSIGDNYYTILHTKLYNQLIGEVPLTEELLKRIEVFNDDCEWVNLDLIKGKSY